MEPYLCLHVPLLNSYLNFCSPHDFHIEPTPNTLSFYTMYICHHIQPKSVDSNPFPLMSIPIDYIGYSHMHVTYLILVAINVFVSHILCILLLHLSLSIFFTTLPSHLPESSFSS